MGLLGNNVPLENASSGVTEDGLPVVDINEPEDAIEEELPPLNAHGQIIEDDIIRHDLLSPNEKARRIAAVNRFLDELEEEEEADKERERAEARVWAAQKKQESAIRAAGGLSAPRAPPCPPTDPDEKKPSASASTPTAASEKPAKKKSVRFKGEDSASDEEQGSGDLVFARLQKPIAPGAGLRGGLARLAASQPMKLDVIERAPGRPKANTGPPSESRRPMPDSDDETPPETPTEASSDEESGQIDREELQELQEDYERRRAQVSIDPAEIDLSLAGRGGIGSGGWDEENVPLEATLASSRPKPAVSRFKSARMKEGGSVSVPEIIPAGTSSAAFANAIRLGRLQDEQLVAAANSDSDEDFERKHAATLDALKNYGSIPTHPATSAVAPPPPEPQRTPSTAVPVRAAVGGVRERVAPGQCVTKLPPTEPAVDSASTPEVQVKPKKVSRFKAEKGGQ
ncbi:hypothetical protein AURDEDRAFT_114423 [Auricularia subglabra TFB-10046 SS5]|nr:hypothetical protein AURDEDRAFT_114423 [Auricularia subglabra TFB-10046 SS5]